MILALLLLLHGPDIRDCQRIQPGDSIRFNHRREVVLDNLSENWQLITRQRGTWQQNIRNYPDLKCYKVKR